ncbi:MAG: sensor domain-containing protein [Anaerolineaceae bacterium]
MNNENIFSSYFGVMVKSRTYLNFLYLLLAFPLGLAYFIVLVTGFSLGLSLIIIWVGLLILAVLFPLIWFLIAFERTQAIYLLGEKIPPMELSSNGEKGLIIRMKEFFTNPVTWKGLLFLFLKFPLGIFAFVLITTGLALGLGLIFAPVIYPFGTIDFGFWIINSFSEAIGVSIVGLLMLPGIFHIFNFAATLFGKLSKILLGQKDFELSTNPAIKENNNDQESIDVSK